MIFDRLTRLSSSVFTRALIHFRRELRPNDSDSLLRIVEGTKFFSTAEIGVALELVKLGIEKGLASGYQFLVAEQKDRVVGYACFGAIPVTQSRYELYWIAVDTRYQRRGIGKKLLHQAESIIKEQGGERIYVETSTRPQYLSTRRFYTACGYRMEAQLADFYAAGDSKRIYCKVLTRGNPASGHH